MKIYGLTGQTGAGKSTVAELLQKKGVFIIDGDKIAREVTEKGSPVLSELAVFFGEDIINEDQTLNRSLLAKRAFGSKENTAALCSITHPAIDRVIRERISFAEKGGFSLCVIDAAALLESPSINLCEKVIVVTAPKELRLARITERDGISNEAALLRINAQKNDEYYISKGDIIIRNYPPFELSTETERIFFEL